MGKTETNLAAAFAGESQARNKYTFFAQVARREGYHYVARIFEEAAENEFEHAKDELKALGGIGDTRANLRAAIEGEDHETRSMYPTFAREAAEEGRQDVATLFTEIAEIEEHHRNRFRRLLEMLEAGTLYRREQPIKWKCSKCGYVYVGTEPPETCPCCKHPREYYEPANLDIE